VTVLLAASVGCAVRLTRQLASAALFCRELGPAPGGLVVVPDGPPAAYAVPGLSGRIVVTTAMLRVLSAGERRALLAHEAAHLRHRHHAYVQLSELAAAANPLLRPTAAAVRVAVERWADDVAALHTGDRRLVARTLARAGLAGAGAPTAAPRAALAAADTEIQQRVHSLLNPARRRRQSTAMLVVAMTLGCGLSALVVGVGVHGVFEVAQAAYVHGR
jgi:beta-lactamase regulating signal transducer with metallopeptidase domain